MIKTIKVKKQLRLDELIKYVWDNELSRETYISDKYLKEVTVMRNGIDCNDIENGVIPRGETFTVEEEHEITEDTWFRNLIQIYETVPGNARMSHLEDSTIKEIINWNENENTKKVYALIDNNLELIWERDSDE